MNFGGTFPPDSLFRKKTPRASYWLVKADPMSTLANSSVGRMLLHFICLVRHPAHLKWHLRGIGREIGIHAHATTL